jgi:hypothetical protein
MASEFFSAFDDRWEGYDPGLRLQNNITVDFLLLKPAGKDLAFTSTTTTSTILSSGVANVTSDNSETDFERQIFKTPRVSFRWMALGDWGFTGSWYRTFNAQQSFSLVNRNINTQVNSAPLSFGTLTVLATVTGGSALYPTSFQVPYNTQISSQASFFFVPLLPTTTLFTDPGGLAAGSLIDTKFEFTSNLQAGFPDVMSFHSSFQMETADFFLSRSVELGHALGSVGFGLQYASITHTYQVDRVNSGGALATRYDPQDGDHDLTPIDPLSEFVDGPDFDHLRYENRYIGLGPKTNFTLNFPPTGSLQFFTKGGTALILGNRRETLAINSVQNGTFVNADARAGPDESALYNGGRFTLSRTVQTTLTRDKMIWMPMAEAELGLSLHLGSPGGLDPVLQAGAVAQYWAGGGTSTNPRADLFLWGGTMSVGLEF